jgi:hypothetical protein
VHCLRGGRGCWLCWASSKGLDGIRREEERARGGIGKGYLNGRRRGVCVATWPGRQRRRLLMYAYLIVSTCVEACGERVQSHRGSIAGRGAEGLESIQTQSPPRVESGGSIHGSKPVEWFG